MDERTRAAAVTVLAELATSNDYRDRADSGVALVRFLDIAEARPVVISLVLDRTDTFVTRATTSALARRGDRAAWEILAIALPRADENSADWIETGIEDVWSLFAGDRDRALAVCRSLQKDHDDQTRVGATKLVDLLSSLSGP